MASDLERIEKWVRKQMVDPIVTHEGERKVIAFATVHVTVGGSKNELQTHKLGSRAVDPKALAEIIVDEIEAHAKGIAQTESGSAFEQYKILCFFSDEPNVPQAEMTYNVKTGLVRPQSEELAATEPPTPQGAMRQGMRHQESVVHAMQLVFTTQHMMMRQALEELKQVRDENMEAIQLAKDVILERAATNHQYELEKEAAKLKIEQWKSLTAFVPMAVNKLFGKEIVPSATAETAVIKSLIDKIGKASPEDAQQLLGILMKIAPTEAAMVVDILIKKQEEENARVAAEAAANVTTPAPNSSPPNGRPS